MEINKKYNDKFTLFGEMHVSTLIKFGIFSGISYYLWGEFLYCIYIEINKYLNIASMKNHQEILLYSSVIDKNVSADNLAWDFIYSWTLYAIPEEILFRSFFLRELLIFFNNKKCEVLAPVVISSVIFGASHYTSHGVFGLIASSVAGFLFSYLYIKFNRGVFVTIISHGVVDTLPLLLSVQVS